MALDSITTDTDFEEHYRTYISLLNRGSFTELKNSYLAPKIVHTDNELDPEGYCELIYPHTTFTVDDLLVNVGRRKVSARLSISIGQDGPQARKCRELVWYEFDAEWRICRAWSIVEEYINGAWGLLVR